MNGPGVLVELGESSDGGSAWGVERQPWLSPACSRSSWRRKKGTGRRELEEDKAHGLCLGEDKAEDGRHGRHRATARRRVARHRRRDGERRERRTAGHASHVGEARLVGFDETRGAGDGFGRGTVRGRLGGRAGARTTSRRETEREARGRWW